MWSAKHQIVTHCSCIKSVDLSHSQPIVPLPMKVSGIPQSHTPLPFSWQVLFVCSVTVFLHFPYCFSASSLCLPCSFFEITKVSAREHRSYTKGPSLESFINSSKWEATYMSRNRKLVRETDYTVIPTHYCVMDEIICWRIGHSFRKVVHRR